jgi:hypothetical protein
MRTEQLKKLKIAFYNCVLRFKIGSLYRIIILHFLKKINKQRILVHGSTRVLS